MSEGIYKAVGILSLIGAILAFLALCLPAAYTYENISYGDYSGKFFGVYWFFGYWYAYVEVTHLGATYNFNVSGFNIDPIGLGIFGMLISMGIIAIIMGFKIKNMDLDPKVGGITMLACGITSIVLIALWIFLVPNVSISRFGYGADIPFWDIFDIIGPGVIIGIISSVIIIISGILALLASKS